MMNRLRTFAGIALSFTLVAALAAGCGQAGRKGTGQTPGKGSEPQPVRFALVTDFGGLSDGGINESAWAGLARIAAETGSRAEAQQSATESDYAANLEYFANLGAELIWGAGDLLEDAVRTVAEQYPELGFAILDGFADVPNVASVTFRLEEGAYLAGVAAASMSSTGIIGFVRGYDTEEARRYEKAFRAGAAAVNGAVRVRTESADSFTDPGRGRKAAAKLIDGGADILLHAAGLAGDGVFEEALARRETGADVKVIGFGRDEGARFGHEVTLASFVKHYDLAVEDMTRRYAEGSLPFGETSLGVADGYVGLALRSPNLPEEVRDAVKRFAEEIGSGRIEVP